MNFQSLADDLIKWRGGNHSLGLIYEDLLRTYSSPTKARAEFIKFLSGEWSQRWVETAASWVAEEQQGGWRTSPQNASLASGDASHYENGHQLDLLSRPECPQSRSASNHQDGSGERRKSGRRAAAHHRSAKKVRTIKNSTQKDRLVRRQVLVRACPDEARQEGEAR
jgi:hypothetical protein